MRVVRRASLILSVVLIVAIAVGYLARTAELGRARDLRLTGDAETAAAELAALIDTVSVAAAAGRSPELVSTALAALDPRLGVCVVARSATACSGSGPTPSAELVAEHEAARAVTPVERHDGRVSVVGERVTIDADGPSVSVIVDVAYPTSSPPWPTTYLPAAATGSQYFDQGNVRQTAVPVPGAIGVFMVDSAAGRVSLPPEEYRFYAVVFALAVVLLVLAGVTLVVEHRNLVERASFDPLTGLPNRGEFERRVRSELATVGDATLGTVGGALLVFDLDGFKQVNDTYGHHAGDEALKVVARRIRRAVRDDDVVGRWGGDEFVVLMPGVCSAEMAAERAGELAHAIAGRARIDGVGASIRIRASVGIALYPQHGDRLDALVETADRAMYEAKRTGVVSRLADEPVEPEPLTTV